MGRPSLASRILLPSRQRRASMRVWLIAVEAEGTPAPPLTAVLVGGSGLNCRADAAVCAEGLFTVHLLTRLPYIYLLVKCYF